MNVDHELHRLFEDDRLELRPSPAAEQLIVNGARRRRRRCRAAMVVGAAVVAVAVTTAGIAISTGGQSAPMSFAAPPHQSTTATTSEPTGEPSALPQGAQDPPNQGVPGKGVPSTGGSTAPKSSTKALSSTASSTPNSTTAAKPPPVAGPKALGPAGHGRLRLGMTEEQAVATGDLVANEKPVSNNGCKGYDYQNSPNKPGFYSVVISGKQGVVRIEGQPGAQTPEGIRVGSTEAEFAAVYPTSAAPHGAVGERVTPVPTNAAANYWIIFREGKVSELRLELAKQDCYQ